MRVILSHGSKAFMYCVSFMSTIIHSARCFMLSPPYIKRHRKSYSSSVVCHFSIGTSVISASLSIENSLKYSHGIKLSQRVIGVHSFIHIIINSTHICLKATLLCQAMRIQKQVRKSPSLRETYSIARRN